MNAVVTRLLKDIASDRADAVEQLLAARPDLTEKQREYARAIGMEKGVAALKEWLADVLPAPEGAAPPSGRAPAGSMPAKVRPSRNAHMNKLFRIENADASDNGVRENPRPGVLVTFSVSKAIGLIRHHAKPRG